MPRVLAAYTGLWPTVRCGTLLKAARTAALRQSFCTFPPTMANRTCLAVLVVVLVAVLAAAAAAKTKAVSRTKAKLAASQAGVVAGSRSGKGKDSSMRPQWDRIPVKMTGML